MPAARDEALRHRHGVLFCALAAGGYGAMAVFAKLAYAAGIGVTTLLAVRFALAAALLWPLALRAGAPDRRTLALGLALGGGLYAAEAGMFFASLQRLDVSLAELLLYVYPAIVVAGAVALGRERLRAASVAALVVGIAGVALVVAGNGAGGLDPLGVVLALAAAAGYAVYILGSDVAMRGAPAATLATVICAGAAVSFTAAGLLGGTLSFAFEPVGWIWLAGLAVISTVVPVLAMLAGIARVGPSTASILSTLEPLVTVGLAFVVLGDRLSAVQLAGGGLVLAAVALAQVRRTATLPARDVGDPAPAPAPARPLGEQPA